MKAKLEFNLPEDTNEHIAAVNAMKYWNCLWDISQKLRNKMKHDECSREMDKLIEELQNMIYDANIEEIN